MWISAGNLFKFCCRAYTLPCCCIRLTSNSNLFLILIVEHDTDTRVNLKDIHMMTDKSNCSQLQVYCDKISYSWWDLLCHHNIWQSLSSGGRSPDRVWLEGLKRKSGSLMLKFLLPIRTKWFGFGLFQQIRLAERVAYSRHPINLRLYSTGEYQHFCQT